MPDFGNMYIPWIFDNGPDMTDRWSGTSTEIPETPEDLHGSLLPGGG